MVLLWSVEIHGQRLVKQENYSAKRKIGFLVETFLYVPSKTAYLPKLHLSVCVTTRLWRLNFRVIRKSGSGPADVIVGIFPRLAAVPRPFAIWSASDLCRAATANA